MYCSQSSAILGSNDPENVGAGDDLSKDAAPDGGVVEVGVSAAQADGALRAS